MVHVDIAVPTTSDLSIEFTVAVDELESPDGSSVERDLTVIVSGQPGSPNSEILGIVFPNDDSRTDYDSSTQSPDGYPELTQAVQTAIASRQIQNRDG